MTNPTIADNISNPGAFCNFDASSNALFASSFLQDSSEQLLC